MILYYHNIIWRDDHTMIISIASTKGGVGKSTLSIHLAHFLTKKNKTLLMDADKQETTLTWAGWRAEEEIQPYIDTQKLPPQGIKQVLEAREKQYQYIIVDVGGSDSSVLRYVLASSDIVIVPTSLSAVDRIATLDMMALIDEAKAYNEKLKTFIAFNKLSTATKEIHSIPEYQSDFPTWAYWLNNKIYERIAYRRSYATGRTAYDKIEEKIDPKAITEMNHLWQEILHDIQK